MLYIFFIVSFPPITFCLAFNFISFAMHICLRIEVNLLFPLFFFSLSFAHLSRLASVSSLFLFEMYIHLVFCTHLPIQKYKILNYLNHLTDRYNRISSLNGITISCEQFNFFSICLFEILHMPQTVQIYYFVRQSFHILRYIRFNGIVT